ncbi:hypothetical protein EDD86DRAFT_246926 [Gorgonomyces haynaldii]|nr:hypothetical protein EDD86DRAFT_246926 [Gorgonomyces haynaldii]
MNVTLDDLVKNNKQFNNRRPGRSNVDSWKEPGGRKEPQQKLCDGDLKHVKIAYDESGRSNGEAQLGYSTEKGQTQAVESFDGEALDEMIMKVEKIDSPFLSRPRKQKQSESKPKSIESRLGGSIEDRLGKRIEERLGVRLQDRLGKKQKPRKEKVEKLEQKKIVRELHEYPEAPQFDGNLI